jgi:hypothetical protein
MNWNEAREGTLRQWNGIRDMVGNADPVALLTEINAVCDLCEKADQVAGTGIGRCQYCYFYQQFGGCLDVSARLSEAVVEKEWETVRALVDDMIVKMRKLELPVQDAA